MKKGLLIIISGPSGVGKGTIRKRIMEIGEVELTYSTSMTTRSIRAGEIEGVDYYFVTQEQFLEHLKNDNFLEHAKFVGNYYGTPRDKVEELRNQGHNILLEIEINGANQVMDKVDDDGLISFFIMPPNLKALEDRIRGRRSESEEIIQERLKKGEAEMQMTTRYDHVILNDDIDRASREIISILQNKINEQ
jgi:guanylate kinase